MQDGLLNEHEQELWQQFRLYVQIDRISVRDYAQQLFIAELLRHCSPATREHYLDVYQTYLNTLLGKASDWRSDNGQKPIGEFLREADPFLLTPPRGGKYRSGDPRRLLIALEVEDALRPVLKKELGKKFRNPAIRKLRLKKVLRNTLNLEEGDLPTAKLAQWAKLSVGDIVLAVAAWKSGLKKSTIERYRKQGRRIEILEILDAIGNLSEEKQLLKGFLAHQSTLSIPR